MQFLILFSVLFYGVNLVNNLINAFSYVFLIQNLSGQNRNPALEQPETHFLLTLKLEMQIEILFLVMGHMEILLNFDGESRLKSQSEFSHSVFSVLRFLHSSPSKFPSFQNLHIFNVFPYFNRDCLLRWLLQQLLACIITFHTNNGKISLLSILFLCQYL